MGLIDQLTRGGDEQQTVQEPLRVSARFLDRVLVTDKDMAEYLGDNLRPPDKSTRSPWFSLSDAFRLASHLRSWDWGEEGMPRWLSEAITESEWARKESWNQNRVAWLFGETVVVQTPYMLTLSESLSPPNLVAHSRYSKLIGGWVISGAESEAETLTTIFMDYDITPSGSLSVFLEGRSEGKETLEDAAQSALDRGVVLPGPFASGRTYKEHQKSAVLALAGNGGGLLADQVGLGKGGEFIGGLLALDRYVKDHKGDPEGAYPLVVSVTKSMKAEIVEEIDKWDDTVSVQVLSGTTPAPLDTDCQVYVLNHDILNARLEDILDVQPVAFIADESHVFKNPDAKRTQAAQRLADEVRANTASPYVTLASGTPFLNSPIELWSILNILGVAREFGAYARKKIGVDKVRIRTRKGWRKVDMYDSRAFEIRWCDGHHDKYGNWYNSGSSNTAELNRLLIKHGMIRRKKSDVIKPLPPLLEGMVVLEPLPEDLAEYTEVETNFRDFLITKARTEALVTGEDPNIAVRVALQKLMKAGDLMQLTTLRMKAAEAKIPQAVEWISRFMDGTQEVKHLDGHTGPVSDDPTRRKLIVFAHHREPRQILLDHPVLQDFGMCHILPGGEQSDADIQYHKNLFQQDDDVRLMICSMAAREGHTLTAAKDVYLHEMPFVPSWVIQMAGRAWARFSEEYDPHEAYVHYGVARGTIDSALVRTNKIKKSMFSSVIDGEGQDDEITDLLATSADTILEALSIGEKEVGIAS